MKHNSDFNYQVAIYKTEGIYPTDFPFNPSKQYLEYKGPTSSKTNLVYEGVREAIHLLNLDHRNFNTVKWNPFKRIIKPGNTVFIKPNLVTHKYGRKIDSQKGDIFSVITHPSVIRAVTDYVAIALNGKGQIIIGDSPSIDANFNTLCKITGLDRFPNFYQKIFGIKCLVFDLREQWCNNLDNYGYGNRMKRLPGDPNGNTIINLHKNSFFYKLNPFLFRGVFNNRIETLKHHWGEIQEYCISNSVYNSDVYISIPKLKTHHKVGATLNIKGLVGTCPKKNYLIHWRVGSKETGGDEYPPIGKIAALLLITIHLITTIMPENWLWHINNIINNFSFIKKILPLPKYRGSWEGNDTCWRMAADLYQVLMNKKRKTFSIIDGFISGEKNGPFTPLTKKTGTIIIGENLIAVDCVAVRLMDFSLLKVKYLSALLEKYHINIDQIKVISNYFKCHNFFNSNHTYLNFIPPTNWSKLKIDNK